MEAFFEPEQKQIDQADYVKVAVQVRVEFDIALVKPIPASSFSFTDLCYCQTVPPN